MTTAFASPPLASEAAKKSTRTRVLPRTTPSRLRVAAVAIAAGSVLLGLIGAGVSSARLAAADDVGLEARPLLVDAESLYVALADADAAASTAFLDAGLEPPELRTRYADDVAAAGERLASISGRDLSGDERRSIEAIAEQLPVYTGLVEAARANNRQDFPVGAAYLRRASALMRDTILPAATNVYTEAANGLHDGYRSGSDEAPVGAWIVIGGVLLVLLVLTQLFVARRTRRVLNVGLVVSTALLLGLGGWAAGALWSEQQALVDAQREGSDHLLVLSTARILALRSLSDENLDLIERGTEPQYLEDFDEVTVSLLAPNGSTGLLQRAEDISRRIDMEIGIDSIVERYERYQRIHERVRLRERDGDYEAAVKLAVNQEASAAAELDAAFADSVQIADERLAAHAADARRALRGVTVGVAVLSVLAGLAAVLGLEQRIKEYR